MDTVDTEYVRYVMHVQVVVEDYVHHPGAKLITLVLIDFGHFLLGAAGIYAILRVMLGGAP